MKTIMTVKKLFIVNVTLDLPCYASALVLALCMLASAKYFGKYDVFDVWWDV